MEFMNYTNIGVGLLLIVVVKYYEQLKQLKP